MEKNSIPYLMKWEQSIIAFFYLFVFLVAYYLTSLQLQSGVSDVGSHLFFVEKIFNGEIYLPHPLWHLCVHYMKYVTFEEKSAAAMVTALFVVFWVYVVHAVYRFWTGKEKNDRWTLLFLAIIFVIGPAYLPTFSKFIIPGVGSPNIIHNTTLFAVKPFALLTVLFTILALEKKILSYYVVGAVSLLFSIFAKPSFVIAFLPALAFYILFKRLFNKETVIYFVLLSLMSVSVLGYQFMHTYGDENDSKVIVDFLGVWSRYSPNVLISIMLGLMFPLVYTLLSIKNVKENNYIQLVWLITLVSIGYAAIFAESGPRYNHGNFFWSYMISLSLLYVVTIADYFKRMNHINRMSKIILNTVLIWQITVGVYYLVRFMEGYDAAGLVVLPKFIS